MQVYFIYPSRELLRKIYLLLVGLGYRTDTEDNFSLAQRSFRHGRSADLIICFDEGKSAREWARGMQMRGIPVVMIVLEEMCEEFPCIREADLLNEKKLMDIINDNIVHSSEHVAGFIPERTSGLC